MDLDASLVISILVVVALLVAVLAIVLVRATGDKNKKVSAPVAQPKVSQVPAQATEQPEVAPQAAVTEVTESEIPGTVDSKQVTGSIRSFAGESWASLSTDIFRINDQR